MPEAMQRRHVMLQCLTHLGVLPYPTDRPVAESERALARAMNISLKALRATKQLFLECGLIDENWRLIDWEREQKTVTPAALRMRAMRSRRQSTLEVAEVE
jgi:hypothetical protein